jgi:flagellar basal-body rod modification protein FlgD
VPVTPVTAPVSAPVGTPARTQTERAPKQEYDSELFLGLLVTQLRNQDPSSSMETSEIVAQTTSLAMMESLSAMRTLVETSALQAQEAFALQMRDAAATLLGKQVSYLDKDGVEHTGTATAVSYKDAVPTVTIDGVSVALDKVSAVNSSVSTEAPETPPATDGADDSQAGSAA